MKEKELPDMRCETENGEGDTSKKVNKSLQNKSLKWGQEQNIMDVAAILPTTSNPCETLIPQKLRLSKL